MLAVVVAVMLLSACARLAPTPATLSVLWDANSPVAAGGKAHSASFNGIVCPAGGDCVAYGNDVAMDGRVRPLLVMREGHVWIPTALPLPTGAEPAPDSYSEVQAASCADRTCLAVGVYTDDRGVLRFFSGVPGANAHASIELPVVGPAKTADDVASGPDEQGDVALSCWSARGCLAALTIDFDDGGMFQHDAFELLRFDGARWTPVRSPSIRLPANKYGTAIDDVSCTARGWCAIAGDASDSMGDSGYGWSAVPDGTDWSASVEPKLAEYDGLSCQSHGPCHAIAGTASGEEALVSLTRAGSAVIRDLPRGVTADDFSCWSSTCAFSGTDYQSYRGYLGTLSAGSAVTRVAAPRVPVHLGEPGAVACASLSWCVAVGGYETSARTGASRPLVETFTNRAWTPTTPALPAGIRSGTLNGIACESRTDCVATGQTNGTVMP